MRIAKIFLLFLISSVFGSFLTTGLFDYEILGKYKDEQGKEIIVSRTMIGPIRKENVTCEYRVRKNQPTITINCKKAGVKTVDTCYYFSDLDHLYILGDSETCNSLTTLTKDK